MIDDFDTDALHRLVQVRMEITHLRAQLREAANSQLHDLLYSLLEREAELIEELGLEAE